jgi:hypothetical protein
MMRKVLLLHRPLTGGGVGSADNTGYWRHRAGLPIRNPHLVVDRRWPLILSPEGSSIRSPKPTASESQRKLTHYRNSYFFTEKGCSSSSIVSSGFTAVTIAPSGPREIARLNSSSLSCGPDAAISTDPSGIFLTHPARSRRRAATRMNQRNPTPCTRPLICRCIAGM